MRPDDRAAVLALWRESLHSVPIRCGPPPLDPTVFFKHPCGLSVVAEQRDQILGAAFCSENGAAGYIHGLAMASPKVDPRIRQALIRRCAVYFRALGLEACHVRNQTVRVEAILDGAANGNPASVFAQFGSADEITPPT